MKKNSNDFSDEVFSQLLRVKSSILKHNPNVNLKQLGRQIVTWHKTHKSLSYNMKKMYVVKTDPLGNAKKGDKHFVKSEGITYRKIRYYKKETRTALREILPVFDLHHPSQIGFTKGHGLGDMLLLSAGNKSTQNKDEKGVVYTKLDIKNAFDAITYDQLKGLLNVVYKVNKYTASEIAKAWTVQGFMVQGHPLTPAIFNLLTRPVLDFVDKHMPGIEIIQYADDVLTKSNIFGTSYMSWKSVRMIAKSFKKMGFTMNVEKEGFFHEQAEIHFIGLRKRKPIGKPNAKTSWYPDHSRAHKARQRALKLIARKTKSKSAINVINGIEEWLKFRERQAKTKWKLAILNGKLIDFNKVKNTVYYQTQFSRLNQNTKYLELNKQKYREWRRELLNSLKDSTQFTITINRNALSKSEEEKVKIIYEKLSCNNKKNLLNEIKTINL